jgi:hypothetical protein
MTTAPQENRGGNRPTAAQNNPANVKGTGGNGQSGRYTGFAYGQNKALAEQMSAASMKQAPSFNAGSFRMADNRSMQQVTPITAATENPDQTIFDGAPVGGGMNSIPGLPQQTESDNTEFNASIRAYAPVLTYINSRPETSKETRQVISLLMRGIQ